MNFRVSARILLLGAAVLSASCINKDYQLGRGLIDTAQQFDIVNAEFPLSEIRMEMADSLSGYSSTRIVVGAVRDELFGLTTRGSAFTLVPALDTIDLGTNPVVTRFRLHTAADTVSVPNERDRYILQNVNVYELTRPLNFNKAGTTTLPEHGTESIAKGHPVFNGADSLAFDFTDAYSARFLKALQGLIDENHAVDTSFTKYTAAIPGIYVDMDAPLGNGGRINLVELSCITPYNGSYYRNANEAIMHIRSTYNGVQKDTSFLFILGEPTFYNESEYISKNEQFYQYAFNYTGHETKTMAGPAADRVFIEGGGGLKPVIAARELRADMLKELSSKGYDPKDVIINKATLELPFEEPEDYLDYELFPTVLSPTVRLMNNGRAAFASLTDASSSSENQGDIDRSNSRYVPDITHHLQELIWLKDEEKLTNYDIWFLNVHEEIIETASETSLDSDYYRQLMYANYYNQLYGDYGYGGYGGYGYGGYGYGYGGYGYGGYGYSNYYSMMMLSNLYNSASSNQVKTTQTLDKDRYYRAVLIGPAATSRTPKLKVTYSVPRI